MDSKKLIHKVLSDLYNSLDEDTKDYFRAFDYDIKFKNFYVVDKQGKKRYIRNTKDIDNIDNFEVDERKYILKNIIREPLSNCIFIGMSSRKSKNYQFVKDCGFKVDENMPELKYEHKNRIYMWNDLSDNDLDNILDKFENNIEYIIDSMQDKYDKFTKCIIAHVDVFTPLEVLRNDIEDGGKDNDVIIIWIHPLYLFSSEKVIKGIVAYELSKLFPEVIELFYKDIIEYCKEYKLLSGKNLPILGELKNIALKRNDIRAIEDINKMEYIN